MRLLGKKHWSYVAGGRIDSPPTYWRGLCLFGSHDGFVYCLEAATGKLAWKYRAAVMERRIVAFGDIESAWPVAGSILVQDGVAYAAAGRAPDADGGIEVHALEAKTGQMIWSSRVEGGSFQGLADYLIGGQNGIFLGNQRFNPQTGKFQTAPTDSQHLRGGKVGLLEASWTKHDLALRKEIQTWKARNVTGQLLAFSSKASVAYDFEGQNIRLFGDENEHLAIASPRQVTGMALTDDVLVVAGGVDRADPALGGFLQVVDIDTGELVNQSELPAEAVFDGVAVAEGCVFVATQDGHLHCYVTNAD